MVGIALAGRSSDTGRAGTAGATADRADSAPVTAIASGARHGTAGPVAGRTDALTIDVPSGPGVPVRGGHVVVRGKVAPSTERVQVLLQTRGATPVVVETVDAAPGRDARTFQAALLLPEPRPTGPAVVQVVAFDRRGRAQDFMLRRVVIGALDATPVGGEDGLMGGLTVGGG